MATASMTGRLRVKSPVISTTLATGRAGGGGGDRAHCLRAGRRPYRSRHRRELAGGCRRPRALSARASSSSLRGRGWREVARREAEPGARGGGQRQPVGVDAVGDGAGQRREDGTVHMGGIAGAGTFAGAEPAEGDSGGGGGVAAGESATAGAAAHVPVGGQYQVCGDGGRHRRGGVVVYDGVSDPVGTGEGPIRLSDLAVGQGDDRGRPVQGGGRAPQRPCLPSCE